jgi:predicted ATPase
MALTLLLLGLPEDAERTRERALEREKLLAHPPTTAWVVAMGLLYAILIDDRNLMEVLSPRMFQQVQKFKVPHFERVARMNVAYLTALKGDPGAGLTEIEACLAEWLAVGYRYLLPLAWIVKIRIQLLINDKIESALETVKVGLAHVAETDEAMLAAELHRLHGVVALASQRERNQNLAEQAFETAIKIARSQEAKWLELRAATSLARLWRDQGRHEEAERLLAPVYNWFTQGLNTRDLLDAKAVLDELSTTSHAAA